VSRHLLPGPEGSEPGTQTVVGWDRPMATYFLQIWPPGQPHAATVWLGLMPGQFYGLDDFLPLLAEHGITVSDALITELFLDRDLGRSNVVTDWRSGRPVQIAP
jgi:hypothetical protein